MALLCLQPAGRASGQVIETLIGAGSKAFGGDGVPAIEAGLNEPHGIVFDASGRLLIADTQNHRIRSVSDSIIHTLAGTGVAGWTGSAKEARWAPIRGPIDVAPAAGGAFAYTDTGNHRIRFVDSDGFVSDFVGNGDPAVAGDGLYATRASVLAPVGLVFDATGRLFWAEGNRVRVLTGNRVWTIAGTGEAGYAGDATSATGAQFNRISDLAVRPDGGIYVADTDNHRVRLIEPSWHRVSTYVGTGSPEYNGDAIPAASASLHTPVALVLDDQNRLLIADAGNRRIRRVKSDGRIETLYWSPVTTQTFLPAGLAIDATGDIFFSQAGVHIIRYNAVSGGASATGTVFAGIGLPLYGGDVAPANQALLVTPSFMTLDPQGRLVFSDTGAHRIRRLDDSGIVSTIAGNGLSSGITWDGSPATQVPIVSPVGLAYDATGNLLIAERDRHVIRMVSPAQQVFRVVGSGSQDYVDSGTKAVAAALDTPWGLVTNSTGEILFADRGNHRVRRAVVGGTLSDLVGDGSAAYFGDGRPGTLASLHMPAGLSLNTTGELLIADEENHRIRLLDATGTVHTLVGGGSPALSGDGVLAVSSALNRPQHAVMDASGNLYVADTQNHRVRKITKDGIISTVAGTGEAGYGGDGGQAIYARLNQPSALLIDKNGDLLIVDSGNSRIRRVNFRRLEPALVNLPGRVAADMPGSATLTVLDSGNGFVLPGRVRSGGQIRADMTLLDRSFATSPLVVSVSWEKFAGQYLPGSLRVNGIPGSVTAGPAGGITFDATADEQSLVDVSLDFLVGDATSSIYGVTSSLGTVVVVDATDPAVNFRSISTQHPGNLTWTRSPDAGVVSTAVEIDNTQPTLHAVELLLSKDDGATYELLDFPSIGDSDILLVSATVRSDSLSSFANNLHQQFNLSATRFQEITSGTAMLVSSTTGRAIFSATVSAHAVDHPLPLTPRHVVLQFGDVLGNRVDEDVGQVGVKAFGPSLISSALLVNGLAAPEGAYLAGPDSPFDSVAELRPGDDVQLVVQFGSFNSTGLERVTADFSSLYPPRLSPHVDALVPSATSLSGSVLTATWTYASVDLGAGLVSEVTFADLDTIGKTALTLSPAGLVPGVTLAAVPGVPGTPRISVQAGAIPQSATTIRVVVHDVDSAFPAVGAHSQVFTVDTQTPEAWISLYADPPFRRSPAALPGIPQRVKGGDRLTYAVEFINPLVSRQGDDFFAQDTTAESITADLSAVAGPWADAVTPTTVMSAPRPGLPTLYLAQFDVIVSEDVGTTDVSSLAPVETLFSIHDDVGNALAVVSPATPIAVDNHAPLINLDGARVKLESGLATALDDRQIEPGQALPSRSTLYPGTALKITGTNISDPADAALDILTTPGALRVFFGDGVGGTYVRTDAIISAQNVFPTFVVTMPPEEALRTTRDFSIIIAASDTLGNSRQKQFLPTFTVNGSPDVVLDVLDSAGTVLAPDAAGQTVTIPAGEQRILAASARDIDGIADTSFTVDPGGRFTTDQRLGDFGGTDVTSELVLVPEEGEYMGPAVVTVSVTDSSGRSTTERLTLFVDQPPSFTAPTAAIYEGDRLVQEIRPVGDSLALTEEQRLVLSLAGSDPDPSAGLTLSVTGTAFLLPNLSRAAFGDRVVTESGDLPVVLGPEAGSLSATFELAPTYRTVSPAVQEVTAEAVFSLSDGRLSQTFSVQVTIAHEPTAPTIFISGIQVDGKSVAPDGTLELREQSRLSVDLIGEDISGEELNLSQTLGAGIGRLVSQPAVDRVVGSFDFEPGMYDADLPEGSPTPVFHDSPIDPANLQFTVTNQSGEQSAVTLDVDIINRPSPPDLITRATLDGVDLSPDDRPLAVVYGQTLVIRAETQDPDMDIVTVVFDAPAGATIRSLQSEYGAAASELTLTFDGSFPLGETVEIRVRARDSLLSSPEVRYSFVVVDLEDRLSFVLPFQGILMSAAGSSFISAATEVVIQETDTLDLVVRARGSQGDETITLQAQGTALANERLDTAIFAGQSVAAQDALPFEAGGLGSVSTSYRLRPGLRAVGPHQATEELTLELVVSSRVLHTEHIVRVVVESVPTVPTISVSRATIDEIPVPAAQILSVDEGSTLVLTLSVDDPGSHEVSLTAQGLPPGATLSPVSATPPFSAELVYTPAPSELTPPPSLVVIRATNDTGAEAEISREIEVLDRYHPPEFQLVFTINGQPAALSDPVALDTLDLFDLRVTGVDPDPNETLVLSVSGTAMAAREFQIVSFARKSVKTGYTLPFELTGIEPVGSVSILPGPFVNLPGEPAKRYAIELSLSDGVLAVTRTISLEVSATTAPPLLSVSAASIDGVSVTPSSHLQIHEGQILSGTVTAIDPMGLDLVLSAAEAQGLAQVQAASGAAEVTGSFFVATGPLHSASSPIEIAFEAENERREVSELVVTVDVLDVDYPSMATYEVFWEGELQPAADVYEVTAGGAVTLVGRGSDPDRAAVLLTVTGAPPGSEVDPPVGFSFARGAEPAIVSVTFVPEVPGEVIDVTFTATDSLTDDPAGDSTVVARLRVKTSNLAPILSIDPSAPDPVRVGETLNLVVFADDPEGDPVTLFGYFDGRPLTAGRDGFPVLNGFYEPGALGASLVFQPEPDHVGEHILSIEASDGESIAREPVLLKVLESIHMPTPTPTPTPQVRPAHLVASQGHGGGTVNKLIRVSDLRRVTNFAGLPKRVAQILETSPDRAANTTVADIDGDGVRDVVVGFGPGGLGSISPSILVVWSPFGGIQDGPRVVTSRGAFWPHAVNSYLRNVHGAVNVTSGNFVGDPLPMIIAAQGLGGSNQIRALRYVEVDGRGRLEMVGTFQGLTWEAVWGYKAGGTAVAAGDVDGDGLDELVVGQMNGQGARTLFQVLNLEKAGETVRVADRTTPVEGTASGYLGLGGVNLAVGDLDGDGRNEIVVGIAGMPEGANGNPDAKNFIRVFRVWVDGDHTILAITPVPGMLNPVQVFGASVNPSGGIDLAVGNLDEDPADELLIGTQAILALDRETGLVTVSHPAPSASVKALNLEFAANGTFLGLSRAVPQFRAFGGEYAPASGAVNVEIYPNDD